MKPAHEITVEGINVPLQGKVIDLTLTDNSGFQSDEFTLVLADANDDIALPKKGAVITVSLGWHGQALVPKGQYIADEISYERHPRELSITARSANFRAGLATVTSKSYKNTTVTEIITKLAKKHDLSPKVAAVFTTTTVEHIDQANESDGHFITRLGLLYDAVASIKSGNLVFTPIGQGQSTSGQDLSPVTVYASDCSSANYTEADRDSQYTGVKAKWQDTEAGRLKWALEGRSDKPQKLKPLHASQAAALAAAKAEWKRLQRGKQSLQLSIAEAIPELGTEVPVVVVGIKTEVDAVSWIVNKVVHNMSGNGYTCSASLSPKPEKD